MFGELLLSVDYDPIKAILFITLVMARDLALPESGPDSEHHENGEKSAETSPQPQWQNPAATQGAEPAADSSKVGKGAGLPPPQPPPREPPHVTVQRAEHSSSGLEGVEFDDVFITVPSPFVLVHLIPNRK